MSVNNVRAFCCIYIINNINHLKVAPDTYLGKSTMRKLFVISLLCITLSAFSQSLQVGDSVTVNPSVQYWMTGERISSWVYTHPHLVTQVCSLYHPHGVLLDVDGAYSWLKEDEVTKVNSDKQESSRANVISHDTVIIRDTIISVQEKEHVVYIHDTTFVTKEVEKQVAISPVVLDEYKFQFYGDFNQYFGKNTYGAGVALTFGARMTEYAFLGGGVEFGYWTTGKNAAHSMEFPVFVNTKIYLPIEDKYYPYIDMSIGANMGYRMSTPDESLRPSGFHYGVYAKGGVGIDLLKCLSLGVGYQYGGGFSNISSDLHHAYLKIGFYIQK